MTTIEHQDSGAAPAPLILCHIEAGVATLTLNNPGELNVLSRQMLEALSGRLEALKDDPAVRVIVLAAKGKAFSAGHDLRELAGRPEAEVKALFDYCTEMMEGLRLHPKPVIAQVQGIAAAAGCQLVASCDLAVASSDARFGTTGIKAGLFCSTPMVPISRVVPTKKALEMLLTGDLISAEEAEQAGLVNRIVPPEELAAAVQDLAERIADRSPYAIRLGKQAFYRQKVLDMEDAYRVGKEAMIANTMSEDGQEGMSAFLEKRKPRFKG